MVRMFPDMWLVIVALLWNIFWLNVETLEKLDKDIMMLSEQQLYQEISATVLYDFLCEIGLLYNI